MEPRLMIADGNQQHARSIHGGKHLAFYKGLQNLLAFRCSISPMICLARKIAILRTSCTKDGL
jgi:hypothetical protein